MRRFILTLAACLMLPGVCRAADRLYLSRSLEFDFKAPGKIAVFDSRGDAPVSEETRRNSWTVILPKRINLTLSIAGDNPDDRHYHVGLRIRNELAPVEKVEGWVTPSDVTKMFWLDVYRVQLTMIRKDAALNRFVWAMVKLEVYVPEPRATPKPAPVPERTSADADRASAGRPKEVEDAGVRPGAIRPGTGRFAVAQGADGR